MVRERLYPVILILIGGGALSMAFVAQYGFGLEPCILCLFQRVPYGLVVVLGFVALVRPGQLKAILLMAAIVFGAGAVLASYHVGVEQHWWVSATGCTGNPGQTFTTADIIKSMQTKPPKPCDAVDWTLFGISMAGWNIPFSLLFAGACVRARRSLSAHG